MNWQNVLELISVLIVFILVLAATYFITKWIGKSGVVPTHTKNIRVLETFKIAPNKYIQIVQLGSKYYSIGISKENITFLTPLEEEQLDLTTEQRDNQSIPFQDLLERVGRRYQNRKKK
jgi:flagellar protein FliO/FliZ